MLRTTAALMQLFWRRVLVAAVVCQFIGNADASTSSFEVLAGILGLWQAALRLWQAVWRPKRSLGQPGQVMMDWVKGHLASQGRW